MRKRKLSSSARRRSVAAFIATLAMTSAYAEEGGPYYGLLRSRDLSPFGFLRLDMRPAHAVTIEPGSWVLEAEFGYQNTWALSPEVEKYLTSIESLGRRDLGPADVETIRALPGENYLLDVEQATIDFTMHYKFAKHWSGYVTLSALSYHGGFLDSTIEGFHETFGFSTFGRPAVRRNDATLIYDLKSSQAVLFGSPTDGGMTDPTVGTRYSGITLKGPWKLSLEAAAKIPLGGRRLLLSSGRTDVGVQASLQRHGEKQAFYVDLAAVYYAGAADPAPQDAQVIPTLIVGYERRLTANTNVNLQAYVSTSVYSHDQTDLDELLATKYQYSIGIRHRVKACMIYFALNENLQNVNNTPDVGFQFGWAYIPKPSPR